MRCRLAFASRSRVSSCCRLRMLASASVFSRSWLGLALGLGLRLGLGFGLGSGWSRGWGKGKGKGKG